MTWSTHSAPSSSQRAARAPCPPPSTNLTLDWSKPIVIASTQRRLLEIRPRNLTELLRHDGDPALTRRMRAEPPMLPDHLGVYIRRNRPRPHFFCHQPSHVACPRAPARTRSCIEQASARPISQLPEVVRSEAEQGSVFACQAHKGASPSSCVAPRSDPEPWRRGYADPFWAEEPTAIEAKPRPANRPSGSRY